MKISLIMELNIFIDLRIARFNCRDKDNFAISAKHLISHLKVSSLAVPKVVKIINNV